MDITSRNLRYLLWQRGVKKETWISQVASWVNCDDSRAEKILSGVGLSDNELGRASEILNIELDELRFSDLIKESNKDILFENIKYLIGSLKHGEKQKFAKAIGVNISNLSKWVKRTHKPSATKFPAISLYFGLPENFDLLTDPIFILGDPISELERKEWIRDKIGKLDKDTLNSYFPVFKKLLKDK